MSVKGMVVVMTFSVMAWKSLGLKWTTEELHTNCCEGQDKILMWNYSLEKNETVENSRWFFNQSTAIAYESESIKFLVARLYMGRVEQIGKMGILLKNVSSVDTGNYSLYLNLGPESPANMQTIFLTVFESPTYQCKPNITKYSEKILFCSTNSCGGIKLSTEWRISEKYVFTSNESYLNINSSWNAEVVSCCLHRQNMQCQNGNLSDFCASTIISFAEDKHAPDSKYTPTVIVAVIVSAMTIFIAVVTVICFRYRYKICKSFAVRRVDEILEQKREAHSMTGGAMQDKDANKELEPIMEPEAHPLMGEHYRSWNPKRYHSWDPIAVQRVNEILEQEREARSMMEGAMQDKDANKEPEPIMEPEAHPLMGVAEQLMDEASEGTRKGGSMMEVAEQLMDEASEGTRKGGSMMEEHYRIWNPSRSSETSRTKLSSDEHSNQSEGKSSDSETKMLHAPL